MSRLLTAAVPPAELLRQFAAQVFSRSELYAWLYLTFALVAIDLFYRFASRPSVGAPWRIYAHPSAILDYKFIFIQRLVVAFFMAPLLVSALALGKLGSGVLTSWLGPGPDWHAGPIALFAFAAVGLFLGDIGHWVSHYLQHKIPFFWELHKLHHAAEVLTPVTANRVHPVETIMDSVLQAPLQALALAVFYYLYGTGQSIAVVGVYVLFPVFYLVEALRHSHLPISFGGKLDFVFSSPAQHQVHHSKAPQHLDTNFSQYFSCLDWIGGTLYLPKEGESLDFGLAEGPDPELNSIRSFYWIPLKRAFRLLLPVSATPANPSSTTVK